MNERRNNGADTVDRVKDAIGGAVGLASAAVGGHSEAMFVKNARIADLYEIRAAEIALSRTRSPELRRYAETMVDDHRNSIHQLEKALVGKDVEVPAELDTRRQSMIEHLVDASDEAFDETYVKQQHAAHSEAMTLFEGYAKSGAGTPLGAYAAGAIPVLKQHRELLGMAEATQT